MEILGYLMLILTTIFIGAFAGEQFLKSRKEITVADEGRRRFIRLHEYRVGRKKMIRTDRNYQLYTCVEGTRLENKEIVFHIDKKGFIEPSTVYENAEVTLAFVGDSTTECALVQPEFRYPYLIGRMLETDGGATVNSYNAGMSSAPSFAMLTTVLYKVLPLRPQAIVWCSNISDLRILLNYKDWPEVCAKKDEDVFYIEGDLRGSFLKRSKNALRALFPEIYTWLYSKKSRAKMAGENLQPGETVLRKLGEEEKERVKRQILMNLKLFIEICCFHSIVPVVSTQASIWKWGGCFTEEDNREIQIYKKILEEHTRMSFRDFVLLFEEVNQMIRDYCQEEGVLLADLEKEIPKDETYIYDYVHYTDEGSQRAAECIYSVLKRAEWKK